MALPEILEQLGCLDKSSPSFPNQLTSLLCEKGYKDCIPKLQDEDVVWLVEYLDNVLETLDSASHAFRKCLRELGRICGTREKLPQSYMLEGSLSILGKRPVASGGSGDIYEGSLGDSAVCVKRLRVYAKEYSRWAKQTFYREAVMWKRLRHPNIVPLLGITLEPLQLISAWMPGGELKDYITKNPDVDQLGLLSGIADGLNYLHSRNMVHGDLKGPNILVDDTGCPRITDFGLAMVAQNQDSIRSAQGDHGHTARWTAPEILNEQGTYSKKADVFAFAMVMVEAFTGNVPFHPYSPPAAMLAILGAKRPERPTNPNLTDELWELMEHCWNQDPHLRPEMSVVLGILHGSDPPLDGVFSSDWALLSASSLMPPESTDLETRKYPEYPKLPPSSRVLELSSADTEVSSPTSLGESTGQDESGSLQPSGSSQATTQNPTQIENDPPHSDKQAVQSSRHGSRSRSRGETLQSEPQTPLPIDPAQVDLSQLRNPAYSHPGWTRKPDTNLRTTPGKDHRVDDAQDNVGVNPNSESGSPSNAHLLENSSTNNPENPNQSQTNLGETVSGPKDPPHSGSRDEKPPDQPGRIEPPNPQPNGTHESSKGNEGLQKTPDLPVVTSSPPKSHGIWCRLKKKLGCVSDENMHP